MVILIWLVMGALGVLISNNALKYESKTIVKTCLLNQSKDINEPCCVY